MLSKKAVMDEELRQLIKRVSKSEANSIERAKAIPLLILKIQQLPGFYKSSHQDYFDALDLTWEWHPMQAVLIKFYKYM